jgi:predicted component of type VI protein secretion system
VCKVGRNADGSSVSFDNDKSISRNHAEVVLQEDGSLMVRDLGSKFGTFVEAPGAEPLKIQSHILVSGQTCLFGALHSRITFHTTKFSFCTTRLERPDKEKLKTYCKILNARTVSHAEGATHLVSNKFAATVKMLTAIVLNVKLISMGWFTFLDCWDTAGPILEIPAVAR